MNRELPVVETRKPPKWEASSTVSIWDYGSDGYLRVHPSAVIDVPSGSSTLKISTTLKNPEWGVVPITVSPSGQLVGVYNGWLNSQVVPTCYVSPEGVQNSYQELFRPSSFGWQKGLSWFFCHQIPKGVLTKRSGQ